MSEEEPDALVAGLDDAEVEVTGVDAYAAVGGDLAGLLDRAAMPGQPPSCAYCEDDPDHPDPDNAGTCTCRAPGCGEPHCPRREFATDNWSGDLVAPDGARVTVYCRYEDNGCWSVGIGQADEGHQLPGWPAAITQAPALTPDRPGYSAALAVDAPEGTVLASVRQDGL